MGVSIIALSLPSLPPLKLQQYPYGVREDQEVLNQLRALIAGDATTEEELYALSRRYEPPSARRPRGGGN